MKPILQNKPGVDSLKIIRLVNANEGAGLEKIIKLASFDRKKVCRLLQNLRGTSNLGPALWPDGKPKRGFYVTAPKGRANAGIAQPVKVEQCTPPSHYTKLAAIVMVSHRPGAWAASAIARRGQAC
jgi:hypothetical protein